MGDSQLRTSEINTRQNRTAYQVSLVAVIVAGLSVPVYLYFALRLGIWQLFAFTADASLLAISTWVSLIRVRRGQTAQGIQFFLWTGEFVFIIGALLLGGLGLALGMGIALGVILVSTQTLSPRQVQTMSLTGIVAGVLALLIDIYKPATQWATPSILQNLLLAFVGGITLVYIFFLIRRFSTIPLTTKILIVSLGLTILPMLALGVQSTRVLNTLLTRHAQDALIITTRQVAAQMDAFIANGLIEIGIEAQNPDMADFLIRQENQAQDPAFTTEVREILHTYLSRDPNFLVSYALLDRRGVNLLDTETSLIGQNEAAQVYFQAAMEKGKPSMSPLLYELQDGKTYLYFSAPVRDGNGAAIGVLRSRYDGAVLQELIKRYNDQLGKDSFAVILDENGVFLAHGLQPNLILQSALTLSPEQTRTLQAQGRLLPGENAAAVLPDLERGLNNIQEQPTFIAETYIAGADTVETPDYVAAIPLENFPWIVLFSEEQTAFRQPVETQVRLTALIAAVLTILAALLAIGLSRPLTVPITALTETAKRITEGDLNAQAAATTQDEIGALAQAFNSMTAQLRGLVGNLEARVAERTSALERRALQIQAAAEIGNAAASMRNLDELLAQAARLISERFGFYHTGIFMLDARGEYAVLRASNSPGGQRMLSRAHRLKVGEVGIVGYVSGQGEARIALDVGQDAVFFDNPDLPGTHSEMALPLKAGGKILGALDVQSTEKAAFSEEDVSTLQILADQLAVAIENAGLFAENQAALEAARRAYGEIAAEAWKQRLQTETNPGYVSAERGNPVSVEKAAWSPESRRALQEGRPVMGEDGAALSIPILLRGQAIGALRLVKPDPARWTEGEIQTAQTLSDQLSGALDSARLYDESQRRAAKERAIGEITSRVGDSINVRDIMQSAVEELGRALAGSEVTLQLREQKTPARVIDRPGRETE